MTTKLEFDYQKKDLWDIVDSWAKENNFKIKKSTDLFKIYSRGGWWSFNAHPSVMVSLENNKVTLDCWITPIWGGKMEISSDNAMGVWAKTAARNAVNKLLDQLHQKPIL